MSLSNTLDLDEAEQVFLYPQLNFGYGTQPPLYTWLQWLAFKTFGLNLFSLAALKNLFLFGTYSILFCLARPLVGTSGAMAASASMLLLPAIGWESQRDLTHSVLLTLIACATLWAYFALLRRADIVRYAGFGVLLGLGMLTKYNFILFILSLAGASILVAEHRQVLWRPRVWISVVSALACFMPHGIWLLANLDLATQGTLEKMTTGHNAGYIANVLHGFGSIARATFAFLTPAWLIYAWLSRHDLHTAKLTRQTPTARFFVVFFTLFFTLLAVLVISGQAQSIKSRWLLPVLFLAPLGFFVLFPALSRACFHQRVLQVAGLFAVIILIALPARLYISALNDHTLRAHYPYAELADQIDRMFPEVHTLILEDKFFSGNLYFQSPQLQPLLLEDTLRKAMPIDGDVLILMPETATPGWLELFQQQYPGLIIVRQGHLRLPMLYRNEKTLNLNYVYLSIASSIQPK